MHGDHIHDRDLVGHQIAKLKDFAVTLKEKFIEHATDAWRYFIKNWDKQGKFSRLIKAAIPSVSWISPPEP